MAEKEIVKSLKQIIGNLEDISKALIDTKKIEDGATTKADVWEKRIKKLIGIVDGERKIKWFTPKKAVAFFGVLLFYGIIATILVWQLVNVLSAIGSYTGILQTSEERLKFLVEQLTSYSALSISIVAIELSIVPVLLAFPRTKSEEFANWYYGKLSKKVDANDKPYLKALINMKCKESDLKLEDIYNLNPDLFNEKSLLNNLYSK